MAGGCCILGIIIPYGMNQELNASRFLKSPNQATQHKFPLRAASHTAVRDDGANADSATHLAARYTTAVASRGETSSRSWQRQQRRDDESSTRSWKHVHLNLYITNSVENRSWKRSRKLRSAAARLLELRFRISSKEWTSVSFECCVLSGRGLCEGCFPVQGRPTQCLCVMQCDQVQQ